MKMHAGSACMLKFGDSGHGQQSFLGAYPHPTNQSTPSTVTPRFKPFTVLNNLKRKNRSQNESEQNIFNEKFAFKLQLNIIRHSGLV